MPIELTEGAWATLKAVQKEGNRVKWTPDDETWGVAEKWEFPVERGANLIEDCDGITLYKMKRLIEEGLDADYLLFTICYDETGGGHAVLTVVTDRGDFVLDNRMVSVETYNGLKRKGYEFLYRSGIGGSLTDSWERILD